MLDAITPDAIAAKANAATTGTGRDLAAFSAAAANLSTRAESAAFIARLKDDLAVHGSDWKNVTLDAYLDALQRQLAEAPATEEPAWRTLAKALLAASCHD